MIFAIILVITAAVIIYRVSRVTAGELELRFAPWPLALLGFLAVVLVVGAVVPATNTVPALILTAVASVALVLLTIWVISDVPRSPAHQWAEAHGVALDDANRNFVERYVSEGHRLRLVCGFGGAIAIAALGRGLGISAPEASGWIVLLLGYLAGVVWSEAWLTLLPEGTHRTASLTPRRLRDYLAGRLVAAQAVLPVIAVVLGLVATFAPVTTHPIPWNPAASNLSVGTQRSITWWFGVASLVIALGIAWLQRRVVTKAQPDGDPSLLAADDAVRASSVHLLGGTGIAIVFIFIAEQLRLLGGLGILGANTANGLGTVCTLAALIAWRYYGHRRWVVRKAAPAEPVPTPIEGVRS